MKLLTWNVNGLRAVERKDSLAPLLAAESPDVLLMNEIKCRAEQVAGLPDKYSAYAQYYHSADKAGYSGVGCWVRADLAHTVHTGMPGWGGVNEGRIIRVDLDESDLTVIGGYFPNGGKSPDAWDEKLRFYDHFLGYINNLRDAGRRIVWGGDINVAHNEIDIARPKDNDGKIGFHPRERAWCDALVAHNWADVFRDQHPETVVYSWWHMRSGARARNVGWRIDSWWCTTSDLAQVTDVRYLTEVLGSDHCPVVLELQL